MNCLVKLPKSFVELYGMVNRAKGSSDDAEDDAGFETAICLLTGAVMKSGTVLLRRTRKVRVVLLCFRCKILPLTLVISVSSSTGGSSSWSVYSPCKKSWIRHWHFLSCSKVYSSVDAQQQISLLSKLVCR